MISSETFLAMLKSKGFNYFSYVPCSMLKGIIKILEKDESVVSYPAPKEDLAISWAVGVYLSEGTPFVMLQNSGLGNILDTVISLAQLYNIPLVMLVTWRGYNKKDEIQHHIWGQRQNNILHAAGIRTVHITKDVEDCLDRAIKIAYSDNAVVALVLKRRSHINEEN